MKIVPYAREIHVEDVPAQLLSCVTFYRRSVPDKRPTIETEIRGTTAAGKNDVIVTSDVRPAHRLSDWNRNHLRIEEIILDAYRNRYRARRPADHVDCAVHRRPVNLAVILSNSWSREGKVKGAAIRQSFALELYTRYSGEFVNEKRNPMVWTGRVWVAHDEPTEQPTIHVRLHVMGMVMKAPRPYHLRAAPRRYKSKSAQEESRRCARLCGLPRRTAKRHRSLCRSALRECGSCGNRSGRR